MILTITANPSVDISYRLDELNIDGVNRAKEELKTAGGKGINVGNVLNTLGAEVVHSGFIGGFLGEFIKNTLKDKNQESRFVVIEEDTRNCIAILHNGKQTEVLERGPEISITERNLFIDNLNYITKDCEIINISGSLPQGLDSSFYTEIIEYGKRNNKFVSVDTSGKTLENIINHDIKPDLIKPNEDELSELLGFDIDKNNLKEILLNKPFEDIKYIIVSLGVDGAIVKIDKYIYKADIPVVKVVNPVGSGDSSVAGALFAISSNKDNKEIIKTSMACGVLNVLNPMTARINMDDFEKYFDKIKVEEI